MAIHTEFIRVMGISRYFGVGVLAQGLGSAWCLTGSNPGRLWPLQGRRFHELHTDLMAIPVQEMC